MTQDQGIASIGPGIHARNIISHRVALPLVIMMHTGHPLRFFARVFNVFIFIEFPDHFPIPVCLDHIPVVLHTEPGGSLAGMPEDMAAFEEFIGKPVKSFPEFDFSAIHVNQ